MATNYKFLLGGGNMGELIRSKDWSQTSLGTPDTWSESLQSAVSISLNSGFPIAIYWGEDFTLLYNDAWSSIPGEKHPWALGKPGPVVWPEIWDGLNAEFKSVLANGESIRQPDALLLMNRFGYTEECYFDYTLSPIMAADGTIGGVFNAVIETSYKVINERRNAVLLQFLQKLNSAKGLQDAYNYIKLVLENAKQDVPFSLLYAGKEDEVSDLQLSLTTGTEHFNVELSWPYSKIIEMNTSYHLAPLEQFFTDPVLSCDGEPCREALIVPISLGDTKISGFFVLGVSPRKKLDSDYQNFLETVGLHVGTILNNSLAYEQDEILQREQALNEELASANEELSAINEELYKTQDELHSLNQELESRVAYRTKELSESEARLKSLIDQSAVGIAVYKGDDMVITIANPPALALADKPSDIIGLPVLKAIPEIAGQAIIDVLYHVYRTGEPFKGHDIPVTLQRKGKLNTFFYNISYTPFVEDGKITGVLQTATEVTEQLLSRRKIEDSEASFRTLVMTSPYALMVLKGREWRIDIVNQQIATLWGKKLEDITGKTLLQVLPELEGQPFPALLQQVYDSGQPFWQEEETFYVNTVNGRERKYISFQYHPLKDSQGTVAGIIVAANDITTLVESRNLLEAAHEEQQSLNEEISATNEELAASNEELLAINEELASTQLNLEKTIKKLAESEARIRYMVNDAPVAIGVLAGRELVIESANKRMLELWGKGPEVIGLRLQIGLPELENQPFLQILDNVYTSGVAFHGNEAFVSLHRNGSLESAYCNFVYHPMKTPEGETLGIMVVATEVTEQVEARKALEESEKRSKFLLNAIPQQVWTATPAGALNFVNQVVCTDFGYREEEIVGHGWQKFIHPDDLQACLEKWVEALQTGKDYMVEFRLLMKNGEYVWHLGRAVPLVENGEIRLWLGTNTNIEIQKNNEQKKDEFLSIASHELKTPLTSIKAFNQLLQRAKDPEKLMNFAAKSSEHIFRLEKLINDLLDVTKINAGKLTYNMESFNFKAMLENSIETVQHMMPSHRITLAESVDIPFTGDQLRLEQVMHNFLTNAVKYSPGADKVVVGCKVLHNNVIVSVQDFGIGIAQDHLDRLFERYYRVDNSAMRFEGLGLGLFISSEILKRHKGSFWIESELGKGSTFYYRLPLHTDPEMKATIKSEVLYQDNSIKIEYNSVKERIDADWQGFHSLESVQKGCNAILDMLTSQNCSKVLNDNSNVLGTWSDATEWVGNIWFPLMEKAGLKYFAWVYSSNSFSKLSAQKSVDVMQGRVVTQFFTDRELAEQWINKKASEGSEKPLTIEGEPFPNISKKP